MKACRTWLAGFGLLLGLTGSSEAVTLSECLEHARAHAPVVQADENAIQAAAFAYQRDQGALWPQLSLGGTQDFRTGDVSVLSVKVAEDFQKLFVDFPDASRLALEKSRWTRQAAELDLEKDVAQAFDELLLLLQKQNDYRVIRRYFEQHIRDIEKLEAAGVDVKLDLERARIRYSLLLTTFNTTVGQIKNRLTELNGLTASAFQESDFSPAAAEPIQTDPQWLDQAERTLTNRIPSTLHSHLDKAEVDAAAADYQASRYFFLPAIGLDFERGTPTDDPTLNGNFVTLDWTAWDWGQKYHDSQRLQKEAEARKELFEGDERDFTVKLRQLIQDLRSDLANYALARDSARRAEGLLGLAQTAYRQGKIKETDLLDIAGSFLDARQQLYDVLEDYYTKKIDLEHDLAGVQP